MRYEASTLHVRVLLPFTLTPRSAEAAEAKLRSTAAFLEMPGWKPRRIDRDDVADPSSLYTREIHAAIQRQFFGSDHGSVRYLQLEPNLLNRWCPEGLEAMVLEKDPEQPGVKGAKAKRRWVPAPGWPTLQVGADDPGIEVWLSPFGVGVLSIGLSMAPPGGMSRETALAVNYALSQRAKGKTHGFRRRGRSDAVFTLDELAGELLGSLEHGMVQEQFTVFSVVRFPREVDLASEETRKQLAPFVTRLAQVEDGAHAGYLDDEIPVASGFVTRHHWAAAGHLGATQILTDQGIPFDETRVKRARDKYFVAYLIALLERLTLERFREWMAETVRRHRAEPAGGGGAYFGDINGELSRLRRDVLEFAASAQVTTVGMRDSLHRYFRMARKALLVEETSAAIHSAIEKLDAACTAEQQAAIAHQMAETAARTLDVQHHLLSLQQKVEWIEVFVIGYYALALGYYAGSSLHFPGDYHGFGSLAVALISTALAFSRLRPDREETKEDKQQARRRWIVTLGLIFLAFVLYVMGGLVMKRLHPEPAAPAHAAVVYR